MLQNFIAGKAECQTFTVDDLLTLGFLPSKSIDHFMKKKGFVFYTNTSDSSTIAGNFIPRGNGKNNSQPEKSIDISIKENLRFVTLHTTALNDYQAGQQRLIKAGFLYDTSKDMSKEAATIFQKANITIKASSVMEDSVMQYCFTLKENAIPASVRYAEDLLQFDSHEFLVSYFGRENVKKDMYYLSEKELKKCSVLFGGTQRQVVFVWDNETYLNDLAYILVTNSLPTEGGKKADPLAGNNEWKLKNGVCPGMALKDLLKINETDFDIYGNKSELSFLVKPNSFGKIDFKKTAVMLTCHECFDNKIFNQSVVSALDIAKANLPVRIFDVVLYPSYH